MTKQFIGQNKSSPNVGLPNQGVARFDGNIQQASSGKYAPSLQPVNFAPVAQSYIEEMNAVANVGEGIYNATVQTGLQSLALEKQSRDAYLASVESDDIVQTNRIYNENMLAGNDPEALATKLGEYRDGKKAQMPEDIQPYYEGSFNKRAAVLTVKSQDAFFQKTQNDNKASLESTQKLIRDDIFKNPLPKTEIEVQAYQDKLTKFQATLQSRVDNGFITPEDATLQQKQFQKDVVTAGYKAQLDTMGPNARAKTIYALSKAKDLPAGLNLQDRQDITNELTAYSDQLDSVKKKAFAEENAAAALDKARQAANLEIKVSRGEATYDEVAQAEQRQLISPEKKVSLFKSLDNETEKRVKESESLQKVARALKGQDYIDPKDADDKKAVDLAYTKGVEPQIAASQDSAAQKTLITNYVSAMGIVPSSLQGKIRGVMRGGSVQDKVFYADLVGRIQESKPQALDDFDDKDVAQAVMIDQLVKSGTPNEEAVKKVEDIANNITPGRIEILKQEFSDKQKAAGKTATDRNAATISHVRNLFDTGFFSTDASLPDRQLGIENAAVNDYNRLYETWYLNTNGNDDLAKQQADRAFKASWGTTAVNGQSKQLTKYPIEQAYPMLNTDEIKDSLVKDLQSLPEYKDIDKNKVFLQYDNRTAREWGSQPSYRVLILNKDGVIEPIPDPSKSRWKPDYKKAVEDKRVNAEMDARLARDKGMTSNEVKQEQKDAASRQRVIDAGKKIGAGIKDLGDKIFSVFISDAGAAEPSAQDLQQFASKQNLTEDQIKKVMVAQNKQIPGSYSKKEMEIMAPLIKARYYRNPPVREEVNLDNYMQYDDLNEQEVRNIMIERGRRHPGLGYSSKELEELPPQIVKRFYRPSKK